MSSRRRAGRTRSKIIVSSGQVNDVFPTRRRCGSRKLAMKWRILLLLLNLLIALGSLSICAEEGPDVQLKGATLKEVLRPIPPKEPSDALRCLEVLDGFSVEFVAHEPLVLDPVAAAIDEMGCS